MRTSTPNSETETQMAAGFPTRWRDATQARLIAIVAVVMLIVTACGGSDTQPQADTASSVETGSSSESESEPDGESADGDDDVGDGGADAEGGGDSQQTTPDAPATNEGGAMAELAEQLGLVSFDGGADQQAEFEARIAEEQRLVALCMKEQGFEYSAATPEIDISGNPFGEAPPGTREFAEQYGFGISTTLDFQIPEMDLDAERADPNANYLEGLTEPERDAYQLALMGEVPAMNEGDDDIVFMGPMSSIGGCMGDAQREVMGQQVDFEAIFSKFAELEERAAGTSLVVEAQKGWASCMQQQGYSASTVENLIAEFRDRFVELGVGPQLPEAPGGGIAIVIGGPAVDLDPETQARVDALADEERMAAVADWDCGEDLRFARQTALDAEAERLLSSDDEWLAEHTVDG